MKADKATGGPGLTSGGVPTEPKISAHRLKLRKTYLTCLNYLEACLKLLRILTWLFPSFLLCHWPFHCFSFSQRRTHRLRLPLFVPRGDSSSSAEDFLFELPELGCLFGLSEVETGAWTSPVSPISECLCPGLFYLRAAERVKRDDNNTSHYNSSGLPTLFEYPGNPEMDQWGRSRGTRC